MRPHMQNVEMHDVIKTNVLEFHSAVSEEKSKMSQQIRDKDGHLVFLISPKHTDLVEKDDILTPVKFRCILFNDFREEVEHFSDNQGQGQPWCFSDRP